ncbi:hypothetical protein BDV98DRAFT_483191, partial [Pterulicium gracile]
SFLFFALGTYVLVLSPFMGLTGFYPLDVLVMDNHYKYLIIFLIPTTAYFTIANWVGWQYYRNS